METKKDIRKRILKEREMLSDEMCLDRSRQIMEKVKQDERYRQSESLLVYADYRHEVMTEDLILHALQNGKKVFCPKIVEIVSNTMEMCFYRIDSLTDLAEGYRGIREPKADAGRRFEAEEITSSVILMPGVAFDRKRNRIGYGKGFYDHFLEQNEGIAAIAVCFDCQLAEEIPAEGFDRKPDVLYTESFTFIEQKPNKQILAEMRE